HPRCLSPPRRPPTHPPPSRIPPPPPPPPPPQPRPPDVRHQHVRGRRQQHPELVRREGVAARPAREQLALLLLDLVLHLPPRAVRLLVQRLRVGVEVRHDVARVGLVARQVLRLRRRPPLPVPRPGGVPDLPERPVRLRRVGPVRRRRLFRPRRRRPLEHLVAGQTQGVLDVVAVAPPHQPPAAEPAVRPHHDADLRPGG